MSSRPRAIFMGTPDFAVPSLVALHEIAEIPLVVTQPDRPQGRGLALKAPPVKQKALELGLTVDQSPRLRAADWLERFSHLAPDVVVVVAFGQILPKPILEWPKHGCINVHASLLPRWRGAAPINWAIRSGDEQTGITLMQMDQGLDTGPMIVQQSMSIEKTDDGISLTRKLSILGAELLREALPRYLAGALKAEPQDASLATLAPKLKKEDGKIDWREDAQALERHVRAMLPWPTAYSFIDQTLVKIFRATAEGNETSAPGTILKVDSEGLSVATGRGVLRIEEVQAAGGKRMAGADFWRGLAGRAALPTQFS